MADDYGHPRPNFSLPKRQPSDRLRRQHVADPATGRCVVDGAHLGTTYHGRPRRSQPRPKPLP